MSDTEAVDVAAVVRLSASEKADLRDWYDWGGRYNERMSRLYRVVEGLVAARVEAAEAKVAAMQESARTLLRYDCTEDYVPPDIDVPDDYERGVTDAAKSVLVDLALADPGDERGQS